MAGRVQVGEQNRQATQAFAAALRDLYTKAGEPTYAELIRHGRTQQPQIVFTSSSLSDWLHGKSTPSNPHALRFLVAYLQAKAARHAEYRPRPAQGWEQLRIAAARERSSARGGRPLTTQSARTDQSLGTVTRADLSNVHARRPGLLIEGLDDPFALEVHRAITVGSQAGLPLLPTYVRREHDAQLREIIEQTTDGPSALAVLVGGSSTGKTRACWEGVHHLPGEWRLWHPISPSPPEAVIEALDEVEPCTVVWLNEAQRYLLTNPSSLGERVAAGLRELLRDAARSPVLILGTIWPEYLAELTAIPRPDSAKDLHAQARELLLNGKVIHVPSSFTGAALSDLRTAADYDPRLATASAQSEGNRITQFLAGAPVLLDQYRNAPSPARALIEVAMDARRLGHGPALSSALLNAAASGYLSAHEWNMLGKRWLDKALKYTDADCFGIPGPLTLIREVPGQRAFDERHYRLADYLEEIGRKERADRLPPAAFWASAIAHADARSQIELGDSAHCRGLYQTSAQLWKKAAMLHTSAALKLLSLRSHMNTQGLVRWCARHAGLDDPGDVARLMWEFKRRGAHDEVVVLAARHPAQSVSLRDSGGLARLLSELQSAGAHDQVASLLALRPAAHVALDDARGIADLLSMLQQMKARAEISLLLGRRPARSVMLADPNDLRLLLDSLRQVQASEEIRVLVEHTKDAGHIAELLNWLRGTGMKELLTTLLARHPAANVNLDDPGGVASLLRTLREMRANAEIARLLDRHPGELVDVNKTRGIYELLIELRKSGDQEAVTVLASRALLAHPDLTDEILRWVQSETVDLAITLARRYVDHIPINDSRNVAALLNILCKIEAWVPAGKLVGRHPGLHATLHAPGAIADLIEVLRNFERYARLDGQPNDMAEAEIHAILARQPIDHVSFDDPGGIARLLNQLYGEWVWWEKAPFGRHLADQAGPPALTDDLEWRRDWTLNMIRTFGQRAAREVPLQEPAGIAQLLHVLKQMPLTGDALATLLARQPAEHVPLEDLTLDKKSDVGKLFNAFYQIGEFGAAIALARRASAAGEYIAFVDYLSYSQKQQQDYGLDQDGQPSSPWDWDRML